MAVVDDGTRSADRVWVGVSECAASSQWAQNSLLPGPKRHPNHEMSLKRSPTDFEDFELLTVVSVIEDFGVSQRDTPRTVLTMDAMVSRSNDAGNDVGAGW